MSEKFKADILSLEPTPPEVFFGHRKFLTTRALGIIAAPVVLTDASTREGKGGLLFEPLSRPDVFPTKRNTRYRLPVGLKRDLTPRKVAASFNNFYEFLAGRGGPVWKYVDNFKVDPWKVEITGECNRPILATRSV